MQKKQWIWGIGKLVLSLSVSSIPKSWCWYVTDNKGWRNQYWFGLRKSDREDDKRKLWAIHLGPFVVMLGLKVVHQ